MNREGDLDSMSMKSGQFVRAAVAAALVAGLLSSCGFRKKYENPITTDTQQPDKMLFDKAIRDIEKGRYDVARITLQTLISTYDTSEFLAKAKLAIADSWFREGGASGLAQAEAEYKEFILFYPTLEEAPEAQQKVCDIHYRQMDKADRDPDQALRADEECRQLLVQFPNSKFAPQAQQRLRNIQEVLGDHEYRIGSFYYTKGSFPAAAARLEGLTEQYPLYSRADEALWKLADAYSRMPARFADRAADAYARIVKEYPLSSFAEAAAQKLQALEREVPEADPVAVARMKYEQANLEKPGLMSHFWGLFKKSPNVAMAAKSGAPSMAALRPTIPVSIPAPASGEAPTADVTAATINGSSALDAGPDARQNPPAGAASGEQAGAETKPLPSNQQPDSKKSQDSKKQQKKK
jgi:outer membrane protein assembly factor BamD